MLGGTYPGESVVHGDELKVTLVDFALIAEVWLVLDLLENRLSWNTSASLHVPVQLDQILDVLLRKTLSSVEIHIEAPLAHSLDLLESDSARCLQ